MTDEDVGADFAHPARVYDYWLGGTDNFPADRAAAEQVLRFMPEILAGRRPGLGLRRGRRRLAARLHHSEAGRQSQVRPPDTSTGTDTGRT